MAARNESVLTVHGVCVRTSSGERSVALMSVKYDDLVEFVDVTTPSGPKKQEKN
jgi:hypothetical protein